MTGTTRSDILGWSSMDEALAFKAAYEALGMSVEMEREWTPEPQDNKAKAVWKAEDERKEWKHH